MDETFMADPVRLETRTERAWADYCAAAERAQRTRDIVDGVEAGRAWSRFVLEFTPASERPTLQGGQ